MRAHHGQGCEGAHDAYAAIETGGTKTLCRIARADGEALAEARWPTGDPLTTADRLTQFIDENVPSDCRLAGIGLASFGPLIVDPASADYGRMLKTPKAGWEGANLRRILAERLHAPVIVDTDVNAAALAEQKIGSARSHSNVAYVTVGTGIGGGFVTGGAVLKGALHPEIGHIRLVRDPHDAAPSGCPYHSDCAEGLASGTSIKKRLGSDRSLREDEPVATLVAGYLAQLLSMLVLSWSPEIIILGGGVLKASALFDRISVAFKKALGDYGASGFEKKPGYLMRPAFEHSGLEGAFLMAKSQNVPQIAPQGVANAGP